MRNFWTIFGYEWKKIWMRKLTWVLAVLLTLWTAYECLPHLRFSDVTFLFVAEDGTEISQTISDFERFQIEREGIRHLDGQVMDEEFFRTMRESLPEQLSADQRNYEYYFYLEDSTYIGYWLKMNGSGSLETITAEEFYATTQDDSVYKLSADEITYWDAMKAQVEIPYTFRDTAGAGAIIDAVRDIIAKFLPLLIAVCLCGVFPQEYSCRTDALIYSSQSGRLPLYLAKVLAAALSTLLLTTAVVAVGAVVSMLAYGGVNFDAALQSFWTGNKWPITMGQAILIQLGLLLIYALLCGGLAMLISLLTENSIAGLAAPVMLVLCGLILQFSAAEYLPGNLIFHLMENYHLIEFLGIQFNWVQAGYLLHGGITIVLFGLCWVVWRQKSRI